MKRIYSLIWSKENELIASVYDIKYTKTNFELVVKISKEKELEETGVTSLIIKKRKYKTNLRYEFVERVEYSTYYLYFYFINLDNEEFDYGEVWDFYIEFGSTKTKTRLLNEALETVPTELLKLTESKLIKFYKTINNNFSFRVINPTVKITLNTFTQLDESRFSVTGNINGLNYDELEEVNFAIHNSADNKRYVNKAIVNKDNLETVFYCEFHFKDFTLKENNEIFNLSLEYIYKQDNNIMKRAILLNENTKMGSVYNVIGKDENSYNIEFLKTKSKRVSFMYVNQDIQVEISEVYVNDKVINLTGKVYGSKSVNVQGSYIVILKKRESDEEANFEVRIENDEFNIDLDINEKIKENELHNGIWDLYLKVNEDYYEFVSRLDDIDKKGEIINIPQILILNKDSESKAVKVYYTLYNELAVLIRNHFIYKSIKKIKFKNNCMKIQGKVNIQPTNFTIEKESRYECKLIYQLPFGESVTVPAEIQLTKNKKSAIEHSFNIDGIVPKEMLENLKENMGYNIVRCEVEIDKGLSVFYFNTFTTMISTQFSDYLSKFKRIQKTKNKLMKKGYSIMNKILPLSKKTIIFQCTTGMNYSCNPKAIYEELLRENISMRAVWVLNNPKQDIPGSPITVKPNTLRYYIYMARAKYFVNNGNFPDAYRKRKGTVHLQTWHGTPLKKLGYDISSSSPSYKENTSVALMKRIERWDYLIAPNSYTSTILQRAFKYDGEMLNVGYPRNDIFYQQVSTEKKDYIKKYLDIPPNKKIILYAPTWRDSDFFSGRSNEPYEFNFDIDRFSKEFNDEFVLLVRLHPRESIRCHLTGNLENVINVSNYDDIKDLYLISDILLTDYSSVMFDFVNTGKPVIFFTPDIKEYSSVLRGFYFDLEKESPGPLITDEEKLFQVLRSPLEMLENYNLRYEDFYNKYSSWEDGNASRRVIEHVFKDLKRKVL